MKIFISGAMTKDPNFKEKFYNAYMFLQNRFPNAVILNPAILPEGLNNSQYMTLDFTMIDCCDTIYMLKDYKDSNGAMLEYCYAKYCNKKIIYQSEVEDYGCRN